MSSFEEKQLRDAIAEILSIDPAELTPETQLSSFESYDSTAQLSLMVCLSDFSTREFGMSEIRQIATYGDVVGLLSQ